MYPMLTLTSALHRVPITASQKQTQKRPVRQLKGKRRPRISVPRKNDAFSWVNEWWDSWKLEINEAQHSSSDSNVDSHSSSDASCHSTFDSHCGH